MNSLLWHPEYMKSILGHIVYLNNILGHTVYMNSLLGHIVYLRLRTMRRMKGMMAKTSPLKYVHCNTVHGTLFIEKTTVRKLNLPLNNYTFIRKKRGAESDYFSLKP